MRIAWRQSHGGSGRPPSHPERMRRPQIRTTTQCPPGAATPPLPEGVQRGVQLCQGQLGPQGGCPRVKARYDRMMRSGKYGPRAHAPMLPCSSLHVPGDARAVDAAPLRCTWRLC